MPTHKEPPITPAEPELASSAPTPAQLPEWLTVAEAALIWRVSAKAVYARIREGEIRVRRIGRILRIPRAEIAATQGGEARKQRFRR